MVSCYFPLRRHFFFPQLPNFNLPVQRGELQDSENVLVYVQAQEPIYSHSSFIRGAS